MTILTAVPPGHYRNPVYPANFPDPFILRFHGRYYAYGTGPAGDGRFFPMLESRDLLHWTEHGGALEPLDLPGAEEYWAPEVAYCEGRFYMYYATGQRLDPDHHLRVAVAEHPLGPWRDAGLNLTPREIFAIDAHPFRDPRDGAWYLYYARDELAPPFAGTGLVVDRLIAMDRLEGKPRPVLRPYADWQTFELKRAVKQGLDWYTVEGPFVLPTDRGYVCFYSGGRWENPNYGVGYLLAEHPLGPWKDDANQAGPQVLKTHLDEVVGPGHNSATVAQDLRTPYLVYHGWDPACAARMLRIDRLEWRDGRPWCDGPSWQPRPLPPTADLACWFDEEGPGPEWQAREGAWEQGPRGLCCPRGPGRLQWAGPIEAFVLETEVRADDPECPRGVRVGEVFAGLTARGLQAGETVVPLPPGFRHAVWHRLTIRRLAGRLRVTVDEHPTAETSLPDGPQPLTLSAGAGGWYSHLLYNRLGP